MKKTLIFFLVGAVLGGLFWALSTNTILFDAMERKNLDGFFFLREPEAADLITGKEKNHYGSDQVQLVAIDDESLGVLGKWPWYRDVHARYLEAIQRFSPAAVYFDVAFIMPEKMPPSLISRLADEPDKLEEISKIFGAMDNNFAKALARYDNVYIDLFLVGEKRPGIAYLDRIIETEKIMEQYSQPAPPEELIYYYSLEPLVKEFMENAQPVTVNQWPDKDTVIRSFMVTHTYENNAGEKRYLFSAVMALLKEYYHVADNNKITIENNKIILHDARAPDLDKNKQPLVSRGLDFAGLKNKVSVSANHSRYNKNIYNYIVNEYSYIRPDDESRIPIYPIHLLKKGDGNYELIAGQEVFDAAVRLGSQKIDAIFYTERDIIIHTEKNYMGVSHIFPINFGGRQEIPYINPYSGEREIYNTIPTESYLKVVSTDIIPNIPALDEDGTIHPDYDTANLESWFYNYCDTKNNEILLAARKKYGDLSNENVILYISKDDPYDGKYVYYKMFFDDIYYLIENGDLTRPERFEDLLAIYPEWLAMNGMTQEEGFHLDLFQVLSTLQDTYSAQLDTFYNKIVFTGAHSAGMADDIKVTPYGYMFGMNVVANAFNTIVTDNQLARSPDNLNAGLLVALCIILALLYGLSNIRVNFYLFILSLLATFTISFILFSFNNYMVKTSPLIIANVAVFITITVIRVLTEEKDKKFLKNTFSQYISPELINTMYDSKTQPELGGASDIITAYFTDIQSFSIFSEKLTAHQLVELLNEYLTDMTDILLAEQGTLDKYEGDAIVAFFGAPMRFEDHALRACRAAVKMQDRLLKLRRKWQADRSDDPNRNTKGLAPEEWDPGSKWPHIVHEMRMRIGINTGEIVTGNMGSKTRMNYTMMGDSVNLAARLEASGKQYGIFSIISEYTYNHKIHGDQGDTLKVADFVEVRFVDNIQVVGKSEPVKIYELAAMKGDLTEREKTLFELFGQAMDLYLAMQWEGAIAKFKECLEYERFPDAKTTPSEVYIKRCEMFKKEPPVATGESWDGVFRLMSK
ncbi:MAG: CHASE2 domain-containing protein [Desulfobacterales bacterium]|nr:CHASE2 domain-containing protein [Desulfobacterales bacterium]